MNKKNFTTKDENGSDLELAVVRPSPKAQVEATLQFNKAWAEAERKGSILRRNLDEVAERHGVWGAEQKSRVAELETQILELERKLRTGAASFSSLEEARGSALELRKLRSERLELLRARNSLDDYTAESFAESTRLQFLVSQCTVYNGGNKGGLQYFKSFDDFLTRSQEAVSLDAYRSYLEFIFGDIPKEELYEEEWLKRYKFVNEDGHLIDSQGRLVAENGHLVDKDGYYINENGHRCDINDNLVDENGNYIVEYIEFGVSSTE